MAPGGSSSACWCAGREKRRRPASPRQAGRGNRICLSLKEPPMASRNTAETKKWRLAGLVLAMAFVLTASVADAGDEISAIERSPRWGHYRDRNFGLEFDFPAHIFSLKSAEQEREGVIFSTADGRARIRVFGVANTANDTPAGYLRRIANPGEGRFTYVRTTRRFFVASGTRDGIIFYRRCNFSASSEKRVGCFQLDYPQTEKRAWDRVVT